MPAATHPLISPLLQATPVRCTRKWSRKGPAPVPSAGWHWGRCCRPRPSPPPPHAPSRRPCKLFFEFALGTPVVLWSGWPFFRKFALSMRNLNPNMYTLVGLGVALAYLFRLFAIFAPGDRKIVG